jgi:FMN reductase
MTPNDTPVIVGLGGSTRPGSSTERAVNAVLEAAKEKGAKTIMFDGPFLAALPIFRPEDATRTAAQRELIDTIAGCDGLVVGSPGYHGTVSGLVKNALDTLEELSRSTPKYLEGRGFGCVVTAYDWQSCGTTLTTLRTIGHALQAWPTPTGVTLNATTRLFDGEGKCVDDEALAQLRRLADQMISFAHYRALMPDSRI